MSAAPKLSLVPAAQWLTAEQVMERLCWSAPTFFRRRDELISRKTDRVASNGRAILEYLESSLPAVAAPAAQTQLTVVAPQGSLLGPLFASAPAQDLPREALTDPKQDAEARQRYEDIRPILLYSQDPARYQSLRLADGSPVRSKTHLVQYVAEAKNLSVSTIKLWLKLYREGGLAALAPKPRHDAGRSRWANANDLNAELAELAAYAHLREDLSIHMAWEIVESRARQLGLPVPSYETIRRILKGLNPAAVTLSKKGRRTYDEVFAPYIRRGYTDIAAGEILVSDHMIHDVLVQNDLFDDRDRKLIRLRFTGLEDMRSRRFTAYAWSQEGSSRSITTVLRHHCIDFGKFRVFYCDNGKDYQKTARGARGGAWNVNDIPPEAMGVLARLDVQVKFCIKFHPQSKLIERANNTIHQRFDRRWATYCGPSPDKRPDRCEKLMTRHNRLLADGRVDESEVPLASEFVRAARAWIEGEYNRLEKNVEGMEGLTPFDAWEQFRWSGASDPIDPAALVPLLASRAARVIRRGGKIELGPRFYVAADPSSAIQLHDRVGQTAIVLYDESDDACIAAVDEAGRVFAYLKPDTLLRQSDDDETQTAIAASMQARHHQFHRVRDQLKELDRRVLTTGYVPQSEQMLQIGRLPIQIDDVVVHRPRKSPKLRPDKQAIAPASASDIAADFLEEL